MDWPSVARPQAAVASDAASIGVARTEPDGWLVNAIEYESQRGVKHPYGLRAFPRGRAEMKEKTIVLAEDDAGQEKLFRHALMQSDFPCRLEVVHDGVELIEFLFCTGQYKGRAPQEVPDLILLDLKMPRMDGLQVLQVLRRVRGDGQPRFPPIVVLTCSDDEQDITDAYRWGAQSYIRKPVSFPELVHAVRETTQYWLSLNRPVPPGRHGLHFAHETV
jgi:two-component system response regulator